MHQGWPKFVQRLVKATPAGGVAITMWGPVKASLPVNGGKANVSIVTDYPFGDVAQILISAPANTPVSFRVPSWANNAALIINNGIPISIGASNGTFYQLSMTASQNNFTVLFNPAIRIESFYGGSVSIKRGALLYGMHIGENFTTLASYAFQSKDYAVNPTTPWNIAVYLPNLADPAASLTFKQISAPGPVPYNASLPPVTISGQGRIVDSWVEEVNAAGPPPASPACGGTGCGSLFPVTLVPFGSTHLRISEIPYVTN
jgi:hypothetical protein